VAPSRERSENILRSAAVYRVNVLLQLRGRIRKLLKSAAHRLPELVRRRAAWKEASPITTQSRHSMSRPTTVSQTHSLEAST